MHRGPQVPMGCPPGPPAPFHFFGACGPPRLAPPPLPPVPWAPTGQVSPTQRTLGPGSAAAPSYPVTPVQGGRCQSAPGPWGGNGVGPVVPVDYANAKLWGVTAEYENILNIQRDQHAAAMRHREAEAAHLMKALELLEAGRMDEAGALARIRAKECEVRAGLEAKQRELELLTGLLQMRDQQVGDLQDLCETKQAQLADVLRAFPAPASCMGSPGHVRQAESSNYDSWAEVAELRREKAELERLLILKDKQMNAVQAVDPSMSDSSALQLGAQAIQMFHDSMRLRSDAASYEREVEELRGEVGRQCELVEDLEAQLAEKRGEVKELAGALTAKTQRSLELEAEVEALHRERRQSVREASSQLDRLQDELAAWQRDCQTTQQLVEELKGELAERDDRYVRQQAECSQQRLHAQQLERKVEDMGSQLATAETMVAEMLRSNKQKDKLVREMSEQVNISESKLHAYQLNELVDSRRRLLDQSSDVDSGLARDREHALDCSRLSVGSGHHGGLAGYGGLGSSGSGVLRRGGPSRHGPLQGAASPGGAGRGPASPAPLDMQRVFAASAVPASASRPHSPRTAASSQCPSPTPASYRSHRRDASGVQEVLPGLHASRSSASASRLPGAGAASAGVSPSPGAATGKDPAALAGAAFSLFTQSYRPYPGDPVDQRVSEFVNRPQNSACKALFCRLGEGSYLYGTQRACLRIHPRTERLEALLEGAWVPIEDFVVRLQLSQGVHLQRAREVAGA